MHVPVARRIGTRRLPLPRRTLHASSTTHRPHPIGKLEEQEQAQSAAAAASTTSSSTSTAGAQAEAAAQESTAPGAGEPVSGPGKFDFQTITSAPSSSTSSPSSSPSSDPSLPGTSQETANQLPVPYSLPHSSRPASQKPPFDTHGFIRTLVREGGFDEGKGKGIMRIAEELLRRKREWAWGVTISRGDLENQAYLFRAALSELRSEASSRSRADSASIRSTLAALRREVDALGQKLKEDVDTLKHEIQMEMNTRKNESRLETKVAEVAMEEVNHKSMITIGDLRTEIEQAKWNNTRRGVGVIAFFVVFIIASVELLPKKPAVPVVPPPAEGGAHTAPPQAAVILGDLREWDEKQSPS